MAASSTSPPNRRSDSFRCEDEKTRIPLFPLSFPAPFLPRSTHPPPRGENQFTRTQRFARSWCLDVARQPETDRSNPPRSPTGRSFFPLCFTAASTPRGTSVKNRHGYRNSYGVNKRNGDRVVSRVGANRLPGDVRSFRYLPKLSDPFPIFLPFISVSINPPSNNRDRK